MGHTAVHGLGFGFGFGGGALAWLVGRRLALVHTAILTGRKSSARSSGPDPRHDACMRVLTVCLAALALAVPLTACGSDNSSVSSPPAGASSSAATAATGLAYVEAAAWTADPARFAGRRVVLFFHAPWCPNCRANEKDIKERLAASTFPAGLTVVKVDYDSSTDLKARHGVVQQNTFVPVDATGAKTGAPVTDPAGVPGLVQAIG